MAIRNLRAGELDHRVAILALTESPNAGFGVDAAYGTPLNRWAKHEPIHGLAMRADAQTGEAPTDLFWVRASSGTQPYDIGATHVIEWRGRRYRVVDTIFDGLRKEFTRIAVKDLGAA